MDLSVILAVIGYLQPVAQTLTAPVLSGVISSRALTLFFTFIRCLGVMPFV